MDAFSKAVLNFSMDLFKEMQKTEQNKNMFCSPLSIFIALKMLMSGAGGNTKSQIEKVLHASEEGSSSKSSKQCEEAQQSSIEELLSIQTGKNDKLSIANGAFIKQLFPLEEKFLQILKKCYRAEVNSVDFKTNPEAERQKINEWVESKTERKIRELFAQGSVNNSSVLVLVNAVYFKGTWANKFDEKNTKEGTFHMNKTETKKVQMMSKSGKFKYADLPEIKSKALMMPYESGISMIIVLPNEIDGLKVMKNATADLIINWLEKQKLTETEVDLTMPKFTMEAGYDLIPMLKSMGMNDVFKENADLSGISKTKGLYVSSVVHKSAIQVNEEGTEAAAATGVGISVTSLPMREKFNVDHPFIIFLIKNKLILFQGVIVSP
ncbi:serpin B4-like [Bufo gargarizans]|uniref:serpin B4-like n=1 Tax=Bufo gargarizans TaxID=30331 RepID=UPI001CF4E217|nr:serpin B4-like [Bufo gargarizans]